MLKGMQILISVFLVLFDLIIKCFFAFVLRFFAVFEFFGNRFVLLFDFYDVSLALVEFLRANIEGFDSFCEAVVVQICRERFWRRWSEWRLRRKPEQLVHGRERFFRMNHAQVIKPKQSANHENDDKNQKKNRFSKSAVSTSHKTHLKRILQ